MKRDLVAEYQANPAPFGRLKPIRFTERRNEQNYWLFECACGVVKEISVSKVKPGCTQSCGCMRREDSTRRLMPFAGRNRLPVATVGLNAVFRKYRSRAKAKALPFGLSIDQFSFMVYQPCYICAAEPSNEFTHLGETFRYNGIDRLDNKKGYVDGNVAACCPLCNYAKRDMGLNEFYQWISSIQRRME